MSFRGVRDSDTTLCSDIPISVRVVQTVVSVLMQHLSSHAGLESFQIKTLRIAQHVCDSRFHFTGEVEGEVEGVGGTGRECFCGHTRGRFASTHTGRCRCVVGCHVVIVLLC